MIDYILLFSYLALVVAIGLWAGRGVTNIKDYATSDRGFGSFVIFATLSASFIGGGFSTGNAEKVFVYGVANIVALWGFSCKEIIVATQIAPRMERFKDAISVGDIMDCAYGKPGRVISGICGVILCCGIIGAQVGAVGYIFQNLFGLDRLVGIAIGCGIVIVYTAIGGMRSVIYTDVLQYVMLAIGMPLALVFGIIQIGGIEPLLASVPPDHLTLPGPEFTWLALAGLFFVFMFGETLVPPYMQRLLAGRNNKAIVRGTLYAGLLSFPFFVVTGLIGLVALALNPDLNPNFALPYVVDTVMPPVLKGILFAAVISIVMSSADSFLNSASIAFVNDIYNPLRKRPMSAPGQLFLAKLVTVIVGIASVVFAVSIESVLDLLVYAYQYWAPIIVVPLVAAIFGYRGTGTFVWSAGVGAVVTFVWGTVLAEPFGLSSIVVGLFANLTVFAALAWRTRKAVD